MDTEAAETRTLDRDVEKGSEEDQENFVDVGRGDEIDFDDRNRKSKFRLAINVYDARKLEGVGKNPKIRVVLKCGSKVKKTKSIQGSLNPQFNERIVFNLECTALELIGKILEFRVVVHVGLKVLYERDAGLVGSYKMDLGMVYKQPQHLYKSRWLILSDAKRSFGEAKGYLKVSIQVTRQGEVPVDLPLSICGLEATEADIHKNLLIPDSVSLLHGVLTIRIYLAEHLPQMDPDFALVKGVRKFFSDSITSTDLVDPLCVVEHAGHQQETPVINNDYDPKWNVEIQIPTSFPSMCDRIQFHVMDKDMHPVPTRSFVATTCLNLSHISEHGKDGFPPTFGPCFINLYGSTREYYKTGCDEYDDINQGKVEGVAYRGRILVEVTSALDRTIPDVINQRIDGSITNKMELDPTFGGYRIKYKLMAVLLSGNMVNPHDHLVEFEVSIGTEGYHLTSEKSGIFPSRTPPVRPIARFAKNHYMPWLEQKPYIVLDVKLEDCSYRLKALNMLLHIAETFNNQLILVKTLLNTADDHTAVKSIQEFLGSIGRKLDMFQALPIYKEANILDKKMREMRLREIEILNKDIRDMQEDLDKCNAQALMKVIEKLTNHLSRIKYLCIEPQNSFPDVIVWMLCDNKRVAVKRIPACEVLYSNQPKESSGKRCGRIQVINLEAPPVLDSTKSSITKQRKGAQLSLVLWLGSEVDFKRQEEEIFRIFVGAEYATYGEVYEYGSYKNSRWKEDDFDYKDNRGQKIKCSKREQLIPSLSKDWEWEPGSRWETMQQSDADGGEFDEVAEKVYKHCYIPKDELDQHKETFWRKDPERGETLKEFNKEDTTCPEGWQWKNDKPEWEHADWLYMKLKTTPRSDWVPHQRPYHRYKCREYTRVRQRKPSSRRDKDGWEYASTDDHDSKYSSTGEALHKTRRRRLTRRAIYRGKHVQSLIKRKMAPEKEVTLQKYITFKESQSHMFQFRAYLYQARDLFRGDHSGLSDPYAIVTFANHSDRTKIIKKTLNPVWNETILISDVRLYGDLSEGGFISKQQNVKGVSVQIWDDDLGRDEFLGEARGKPVIQLGKVKRRVELQWLPLRREGENAGELLAAFELEPYKGERRPPFVPGIGERGQTVIPERVAPKMERYTIEFRVWGVRDMKKLLALGVSSPKIELECEGTSLIATECLSDATKNHNFPLHMCFQTCDKHIPVGKYLPSMAIKVYDKRLLSRTLHVGTHTIRSVQPYVVPLKDRRKKIKHSDLQIPDEAKPFNEDVKPPVADEASILYDWWSKYYSSKDPRPDTDNSDWVQQGYIDDAHMDTLKIYPNPLEANFGDHLMDFLQTFPLYRGKGGAHGDDDPEDQVGHVKGAIRLYPKVGQEEGYGDFGTVLSPFPTSDVNILVRVYVVEAFNLTPQDMITGSSDPYLLVSIGKTKLDSKKDKLKNDLNPVFGRMFELDATLPRDHTLSVTVMDYDRIKLRDDVIGTTKIDVENRFYSNHGATCGLPETVTVHGINKWRNRLSPVELLYDWVEREGLPKPRWRDYNKDNPRLLKVDVGGRTYDLADEKEADLPAEICPHPHQRLALKVLNSVTEKGGEKLDGKDGGERKFMREHVETRTLYNPLQPSVVQGKLRMWVDIFDRCYPIPPPVVIARREPEEYQLRVIVWNVMDVEFEEQSIVTSEPMTDIVVKGWFCTEQSTQKTDVHYRSLDGNGSFNWRFIFPFKYITAENRVVFEEKECFWHLDKTRTKQEPVLNIEIWDDDAFSRDDFIGSVSFKLTEMLPSMRQQSLLNSPPPHNLFVTRRMKGWWEVTCIEQSEEDAGKSETRKKGKIQLEFELLKRSEVEKKPAGKGRDAPNMNPYLHTPKRPDSSFFWLISPLKTFRFIIWKFYKWYIIGVIGLVILIAVIIALAYTLPSQVIQASVNRLLLV